MPFRLSAGFAPATATGTLFNSKPRLLSRGGCVLGTGRSRAGGAWQRANRAGVQGASAKATP